MKYVIIKDRGTQYKVEPGEEILVAKLGENKFSPDVLLSVNDTDVKVGKPSLPDVKIKFEVVNDLEKGEKINGFKYKSKSRYRRKFGSRAKFTRIKVTSIA